MKDTMLEKGFSREKVEELSSPIGLSIRAETPEEIAVSVMAEIIEVKNKAGRTESLSSEMLKALTRKRRTGKVLATIVHRRGSAPRKVGTKMMIFPEGKTMGTIGGGCMEAEVIQQALGMLRTGKAGIQIYPVNMTSETAEEEGMVCAGQHRCAVGGFMTCPQMRIEAERMSCDIESKIQKMKSPVKSSEHHQCC